MCIYYVVYRLDRYIVNDYTNSCCIFINTSKEITSLNWHLIETILIKLRNKLLRFNQRAENNNDRRDHVLDRSKNFVHLPSVFSPLLENYRTIFISSRTIPPFTARNSLVPWNICRKLKNPRRARPTANRLRRINTIQGNAWKARSANIIAK